MSIVNYTVLHAWGVTFEKANERLTKLVFAYLKAGWEPYGSLSVTISKNERKNIAYTDGVDLAQAMIMKGRWE
jgi:hypothetical protein